MTESAASQTDAVQCCKGHCRRKHPILIRRGWISGRWYAVTRYKDLGSGDVEAQEKHDITEDLVPYLISQGWTPPPSEEED